MKKGDTIGITYTDEKIVDLVAEIEKIEDGVIFFWVWNGCWDGRFYPNGTVEAYDRERLVTTVLRCRIVYVGKVPGNYNDAIDYMNKHLQRNAIERWWIRVSEGAKTYVQRFKTACSAFVKAWRGELAIDKREPFDDDSIPF